MSVPSVGWRWSPPPRPVVPALSARAVWRARWLSADPGLLRLHGAAGTALAVVSVVAVELLTADATGGESTVAMLVGAVVVMFGCRSVTDATLSLRLLTIAGMPLAFGLGALIALAVSGDQRLVTIGYVCVIFLAGYVRRFGQRATGYGFLFWMGYFLSVLLEVGRSSLGLVALATVVAVAWLAVLFATVLRENPERTLRLLLEAFWWRGACVATAAMAVIDSETAGADASGPRPRRRLQDRVLALNEAALLIEGHLALLATQRPHFDVGSVRTRVLRAQLAYDGVAAAARVGFSGSTPQVRLRARLALQAMAAGDSGMARHLSSSIERSEPTHAGRLRGPARLARAVRELAQARDGTAAVPPSAQRAFSAAVTLSGRNLPGTATIGRALGRSAAHGRLARLEPTTRQAVRAALAGALALLAGRAIDPVRYYWALIAAFVCFTGTTTVAETTRKGMARAGGTLTGLVASVLLAELTAGHRVVTFAVITAAIFLGFYLQPVSYAGMIFFITVMIGQLYTLLHTFTPGLLVLRLEETAVGAAAGIVISVSVLPTRTRTVARLARQEFFAGLRDMLLAAAECTDGHRDPGGLLGAARVVDLRLRQYIRVTQPLLSSHDFGRAVARRPRGVDLAMLATRSRALGQALVAEPDQPALAEPLRVLAGACADLVVQVTPHVEPTMTDAFGPAVETLAEQAATSLAARLAAALAEDLMALLCAVGQNLRPSPPTSLTGRTPAAPACAAPPGRAHRPDGS